MMALQDSGIGVTACRAGGRRFDTGDGGCGNAQRGIDRQGGAKIG
jgi:hypothetical protein